MGLHKTRLVYSWVQDTLSEKLLVVAFHILVFGLSIIVLRRLCFHSLARIPGPRLAALTDLYAFYFNFIRGDGYSKRFQELHAKYNSPIIRIGPNHVHLNDPEFFEEVFCVGSKYAKDPSFYQHFGGLDSMVDPQDYRTYRSHIAPLYSARSADELAPSVLNELQEIAARLRRHLSMDEPVNILQVFRTLSADIVLRILFSQDVNLFDCETYHPFLVALDTVMNKTWLILTYPAAASLLGLVPGSSYRAFGSAFETFTKYCEEWAANDVRLAKQGDQPQRDSHMKRYAQIDPADKKKVRAVLHPLKDIFNFIAGGSDTTAYSTTCAVHYLLTSPEALSKLQAELDEAAPFIRDHFDHNKIATLPYLGAVVKEALRLSSPVPGCLPRLVPEPGTKCGTIFLPPGTTVSVSLLSIQQNEHIFRDPQAFLPERWLGEDAAATRKWNVAFSRGPRQCIGVNIAYLELHACLAYLFSHFEFALSDTTDTDLKWVDRFVAHNTKDVMIRVVGDRQSFLPYWLLNGCAARGWIFVTPDYRLLPEVTAHEAVADALDAYLWIRQSLASALNISIGPVISAGSSAGAYLALTSASLAAPSHKPDALLFLYGILDPLHERYNQPVGNFFGMSPIDSQPFFDEWEEGQRKAATDGKPSQALSGYPIPQNPSADVRMGLIAALHCMARLPDYMAGIPGLGSKIRGNYNDKNSSGGDGSGSNAKSVMVDLVPEKARELFAIALGRVAGLPRTAVLHGRNDAAVPFAVSQSATETLRQLGVAVHTEFPDDAPHGFDAMVGNVDIEQSKEPSLDTPAFDGLRGVLRWLDTVVVF
ncbi:elymoclavine monooxygenase [Penicillium hordei]|uniref:Elymoclavine monooxygenase n=1 Tax=Penicillium hordei TaxID=40994 RepID=A0AAD6E149_9EURO|nr:elymoclavine monooxygenase [Penicillium hordei]KAJ5598078.1 elymoclavine monooxygenase [Penicillium hordei]